MSAGETNIRAEDLVVSVREALQFISCNHPPEYIRHLTRAYEAERSPEAREAIAQILVNSRMAAEGFRPICQDTGIVEIFISVGIGVRILGERPLTEVIDEGVRAAYLDPVNPLRRSIVREPLSTRANTGDNTPAIVHTELVTGNRIVVTVMAKGAGSENKSRLAMLKPHDSVSDWVVRTVETLGAGWCPPGIIGIGVGGTADKALLLAKVALTEPIDMYSLLSRGPSNEIEALRVELYERINALGIGAQGLGGVTTVLDIKVREFPTHAASLPVALVPNCAATRVATFELDGSGPVAFQAAPSNTWPQFTWRPDASYCRVNLDKLNREEVERWQIGDRLLLSGRLLTARDAAHRRIGELLRIGGPLPDGLSFENRTLYYVGPVDPTRNEVIGPAGPTTAARMDEFTPLMLGKLGLLAMIGKAERGPEAVEAIKRYRATYLVAVGGAAYLISKSILSSRVLAFSDLGMEAVRELEVEDFPVIVGVSSGGESIHVEGPARWRRP